jgi:hypothetical protein
MDIAEGVADETARAKRSTVFISCASPDAVLANAVVGAFVIAGRVR